MSHDGPTLTTYVFQVNAMFCQSCPATIKKKLSAEPWVTSVDANLETKTATVIVNDPHYGAQTIIKYIAEHVGLTGAVWINDPNLDHGNDKSKRSVFGYQ